MKPDKKKALIREREKELALLKAKSKLGISEEAIPEASPMKLVSVAPTDTSRQICSLVDLNTISGSTERLRNGLGGYFYTDTDSFGLLNVPPSFVKFDPINNIHPSIFNVRSITGSVVQTPIEARGFGQQYSEYRKAQIPFTQFTCRVEGDPTSKYLDDVMKGSKFWKTLFLGGTFLDRYYTPLYTTGAYDNHYTVINIPYNNKDKIHLKNKTSPHEFMAATYDYNRYFPKYQSFAKQIDNERKLPNWYMLSIVSSVGAIGSPNKSGRYERDYSETFLEPYNIDYYTLGESVDKYDSLIALKNIFAPGAAPGRDGSTAGISKETPSFSDRLQPSTHYINTLIPSNYSKMLPQTINEHEHRNRNLIFPKDSVSTLLSDNSFYNENAVRWPYYNKIEIDTDRGGSNITYRAMIDDSSSDTIFMKILKEAFLGQTGGAVPIRNQQFMKTSKYMTGSNNSMRDNIVTSNYAVSYRTVDMVRMLMYGYENVYNTLADFQIMDWSDLDTTAAIDTRGLYRAVNSKRLATLITDVFTTFGGPAAGTKVSDIVSLLNCRYTNILEDERDRYSAEKIEAANPEPAYNEVVAYRIEKIGGSPSGDSNTQGVIQNFWVYSDMDVDEMKLLDSQIKYDVDYEYRIYAYYIVKGYKYRYSDLQLSRIIGQVREDGDTGPLELASGPDGGPPVPPIGYCLEYYDPYTDRAIPDAIVADSEIYNSDPEIIESISRLSGDAQRIGVSSFKASEGDRAYPPYVAQFNLTLQPSLKIIEVPLMQKIYRVLDSPPNELDISPGYTLNNDNTITFSMSYESFSPHKYPRSINSKDAQNGSNYINANDIAGNTFINNETISYPKEIEIYRLNQKPKTFSDFDTVAPRKVSLKIDGSEFSYTTALFNDTIKSNNKYYYLFRVTNDNGIAGNVDTIIEAELVNDGGYKYAIFDTLFEEDLIEEEFVNPSTTFKNIFQLSPNMSQLMIDTSQANFDNPLGLFGDQNENDIPDFLEKGSEYKNVKVGIAEDLIWGKTFKIRLTSKKTGKKIDLNITYSDPDINLPRK